MIQQAEIGDIVVFRPLADEVYMWAIPEYGASGSVRALTYNVGLSQMLGIYLPMCLVDFGLENYTPVYLEDLKLKNKYHGETESINSGSDSIN